MAWSSAVVVNGGLNMLNQSAGIILDYAAGGTGVENAPALMAQTALKNQKQVLPIVDIREVEHGKKLNILVSNTGLAVGYKLQQIGIWAHTGDETPKLFAILQDDSGIDVPAETEVADFSLNFYAVIKYSGEASFSLSVDPSALVSHSDLDDALDDAISALLQTITEALGGAVPTTRKVNGKALSSDISLNAADVGARPNTWTPTAADVGAAASGHTHSASDVGALAANGTAAAATKLETPRTIRTNLGSTATASFDGTDNVTPGVTGTLPLANGGTGVTSLAALKTALGITGTAKIQTGSYVGTGTYGASNPCSLTFDFIPKVITMLLSVSKLTENITEYPSILLGGGGGTIMAADILTTTPKPYLGFISNSNFRSSAYAYKSSDSKTVYWYVDKSDLGAPGQFNTTGAKYYWLALG